MEVRKSPGSKSIGSTAKDNDVLLHAPSFWHIYQLVLVKKETRGRHALYDYKNFSNHFYILRLNLTLPQYNSPLNLERESIFTVFCLMYGHEFKLARYFMNSVHNSIIYSPLLSSI